MRLKILAISDTHLADSVSLLSSPRGRRHLGETLRRQFGPEDELEVEELILVGDILERVYSPLSEVLNHTRDFIETLRGVSAIERIVYLVGDHDYLLWTAYHKSLCGEDNPYGITSPSGDLLLERGRRRDERESATELLSIFFAYPSGQLWKEIEREAGLDFVIANPLYAKRVAGRTYVFTHGTHFRREVVKPPWVKKLADLLAPDKILNIGSYPDVREPRNLAELERILAPFFDNLGNAYEDNPRARWRSRLFYLHAVLRGKFGKVTNAPKESRLFSREELRGVPEERIRRLTADGRPKYKPLRWWQKYFLPHMLSYLRDNDLPQDDVTFVFGDTHDGGWGELPLGSGAQMRIYNLGGWALYDAKGHPDCHLLGVDEAGEEYLLDVSFKGLREGEIRFYD